MRSAKKHLLQEGALWAMLGASLLAALYHFDDIKALIGPEGTAERLSLAARTAAGKPKEPGFASEVHLRADRRATSSLRET